MSEKTFYSSVGLIFLLISVIHLLRILNGWVATIGTFDVPMWFSWVAVVVTGTFSYQALRRK